MLYRPLSAEIGRKTKLYILVAIPLGIFSAVLRHAFHYDNGSNVITDGVYLRACTDGRLLKILEN